MKKYLERTLILGKLFLLLFALTTFSHCKKFLDKKITKSDIVPNTLDELQTLLDNNEAMNGSDPYLLEAVSDNFYVTPSVWNPRSSTSGAQHYIWAANATPDAPSWSLPYGGPIYISNVVLDQLPSIKFKDSVNNKYNAIKGSCLFYRSFAFYCLSQLYCKPYSIENANSQGVVLRLTSNYTVNSTRATVQETYDRITSDLLSATELLPNKTSFPTRPTRAAAYAMLARVYLSMRKYDDAEKYADSALQLHNQLIDYNLLVPVGFPPIPTFNPEVIYHSYSTGNIITNSIFARIDSNLYNSYDDNDLRKTVFFRPNFGPNAGTYAFRGSYNGDLGADIIFTGLTTSELYLIRSECQARKGNLQEAMTDLNILVKSRWNNLVAYPSIVASDQTDAINKILLERRKELVFRGQRWTDIRRLNLEGANITLTRVLGTNTYTLPPNDLRAVMLIPTDEINKSGIEQNPR